MPTVKLIRLPSKTKTPKATPVVTPAPTPTALPTAAPTTEYWEKGLIFFDDFNDGLKIDKYTFLDRGENYNQEIQYYHPDNIFIKDGNLVIRAEKRNYKDHEYVSGRLETYSKLEFLYGRIEIKAKYPAGNGLFVAIWLLSNEENLPEIDILEVLGENPGKIWVVNHYKKDSETLRTYNTYRIKSPDEFHVYCLDWNKNKISWFIDDELIHTSEKGIPQKKMYLVINLALGGIWPVLPDDSTVFPADLLIDYIKIYEEGY